MKIYDKPPLPPDKHIELLKQRGLEIFDEDSAKRVLAYTGYYRLSAYMLPYKMRQEGEIQDQFREGMTWNMIYGLYLFDRELRLLVFDVIERLEIALRSQIVTQLSAKYGSHWQDRVDIFKGREEYILKNGRKVTVDVYDILQQHTKEQMRDNRTEAFIQHYRKTYVQPENPPSWMCMEFMYFSHLSRICTGLKYRADVNGIAVYFGLPPQTLCSWLHTLNYVRNICAHHARLWNRDMNIVPERLSFSKKLEWIAHPEKIRRHKIYYVLCMLNYMLQAVDSAPYFVKRLRALSAKYQPTVTFTAMGMPLDWCEEKMWKTSCYV